MSIVRMGCESTVRRNENIHPDRDNAARCDNPHFGIFKAWWGKAITAYLAEQPQYPIK